MNFIKKIFDGKSDESVHLQFQKFSKGEFRNRALVEVKKSRGKYAIKTSAEFANELVRIIAEKLGEDKTKITGAIVSTQDLTKDIEFKDKKQFQGVKRYLIDNEMSGNAIIDLLNKMPKTFFALSFEAKGSKLKIKPKAPKSGKPGKEKDGGPKADFCSLKTEDAEIGKMFVWEKDNFKIAKINHTFFIDSIKIPNELKTSQDFARIREESLRVGRIVREAIIDEEIFKCEKNFEA